MAYKNIKSFLDRLEKEGELIRIKEELDPKYEVSAIFKQLGQKNGPAALIEKVKGYDIPVAGNLYGSRKRLALALETEEAVLPDEFERRMKDRIAPRLVKEAPVKEVAVKDGIDILKIMPVLTYHKRDISPYITQGVTFLRDPETGIVNMSIKRTQVKDRHRLGTYPSPATTAEKIFRKAKEMGKSLEIAIAIGVEPAVLLAALAMTPPGGDKMGLAGSLKGEGIEVVKAETVDFEVPANAMFVLEGIISPEGWELDGPFGESSGYYIPAINPVIEVKAVTHQRDSVYTFFRPVTPTEDAALAEFLIYKAQYRLLKSLIPSLRDVISFTYGGPMIMSIEKKSDADGRFALYTALSMVPYAKTAIVVDEDVDIRDPKDVAWALFGRFQPDKDLIVLTDIPGHCLDPSVKKGDITAKMGLDATKPLDQLEKFERVDVPEEADERAKEILKRYL